METPLKIVFHGMDTSPAVAAAIQRRVERLERLHGHIISARVSVEHEHSRKRHGNVYSVHVDLVVPGHELAVSREPTQALRRYAKPTVYTSLRDAFNAAERRLKKLRQEQQGIAKHHPAALQGTVDRLARDHGFLTTRTGADLYFHANSLIGCALGDLAPGDTVRYVEELGDTGPNAAKVWRDVVRAPG